MIRFMRNNRGQFVVIAAILIAVLTFSLAASIYQISLQRQELSYKPVQELVLGTTSDFERALNIALNVSSHNYNATYSKVYQTTYNPILADAAARIDANATGSSFIANWTRSVLTTYANTGLKTSVPQEYVSFSYMGWDNTTASIYATATINIDAPAYGFQGYVGRSFKRVTLSIDVESIDVTEPGETTLKFNINESSGFGSDLPIPNLTSQNLAVQAHQTGIAWTPGNVIALTYLGNGEYVLTFTPRINTETLGVKIAVSTPKEGILIEAEHYRLYVRVNLQSQLLDSPAPTNDGQIDFGDLRRLSLPNSTITPVGSYGIGYIPIFGYTFDHWNVTQGLSTIENSTLNPTTVTVNESCTITAFYKPGSKDYPNETYTVWLYSQESDNSTRSKGTITWDSITHSLPDQVINVLPYPVEHPVSYTTETNSTYVFRSWNHTVGVIPWNGTNADTKVSVTQNGTLIAVYGPAPFIGGGGTLYVDENNNLHTDAQLSDKWYKGGRGIKLQSYSNQGKANQEVDANSTALPTNYVASVITATMYVEVSQVQNAKNVTISIGFYYSGQYYDLGSQTFDVANQDIGVYTLNINVLDTGQWTPLGEGVIPAGSIFSLKVNVYYFQPAYGTMFVHYGQDYPSQINFY